MINRGHIFILHGLFFGVNVKLFFVKKRIVFSWIDKVSKKLRINNHYEVMN